jgi:pyridoxamine 5'-phosphate oxidase
MTDLPDSAPGFDQPIAVLKHCHDRIRKQLATLGKLGPHLAANGADEQTRQAALAIMKYFDKAAHWHHADEEENLLPMLQATAHGEDAALLAQLGPAILEEHRLMDAMWQGLHEQLSAIAAGAGTDLRQSEVQRFIDMYSAHMEREECHIAPMAKRLFSAQQMAQLGQAMQARRGLAPPLPSGDALASLRKDYGQATLSEAAPRLHRLPQLRHLLR